MILPKLVNGPGAPQQHRHCPFDGRAEGINEQNAENYCEEPAIKAPTLSITHATCAQPPSMPIAANSRCPPFVLDIPRHAAPSMNVVEGLEV